MNTQKIRITKNQIVYSFKGRDITKNVHFNIEDIYRQIQDIKFQAVYDAAGGQGNRNENLENAKIPPMAYAYYCTLCVKCRVPLPIEVINTYIRYFCVNKNNGFYSIKPEFSENEIVFTRNELAGRICRAYNSFNREFVLLVQLSNLSDEYEIYYDFHTDYYDGIDIVIQKDDAKAGIAVFQKSINAYRYRKIKEAYRHKYGDIKLFSAISDNENTTKCGDVDLFTYKYIYELYHNISDYFSKQQIKPKEVEIHLLTPENTYIRGKDLPIPF